MYRLKMYCDVTFICVLSFSHGCIDVNHSALTFTMTFKILTVYWNIKLYSFLHYLTIPHYAYFYSLLWQLKKNL